MVPLAPGENMDIDPNKLTLNYGDTFAVLDRWGDVRNLGERHQGLFYKGCRYLSWWEISLAGQRPELLSSTVREESDCLSADMTNAQMTVNGVVLPRGSIHIGRLKFLKNGECYERVIVQNFTPEPIEAPLSVDFRSNFHDIFELRGFERRSPRGETATGSDQGLFKLSYRGADGIERVLRIEFPEDWTLVSAGSFQRKVNLPPHGRFEFQYRIALSQGGESIPPPNHDKALKELELRVKGEKELIADVVTPNSLFNHWVNRSKLDLVTLLCDVGSYKYPFAGVPWYNTIFGRDGLITALQCLLFAPSIARNVLLYLADHQAKEDDPLFDAEPGKILHEVRGGELVNIGEVPFKHYYGSVDSTPLFVWLAGLYGQRTNDLDLIEKIWPNLERALHWIDRFGDCDGNGFVEYQKNPNTVS
jgi:glycogen debranching enzyme